MSLGRTGNSGLFILGFLMAAVTISAQTTSQDREDKGMQWSLGGGVVASPRPYIGTDPKIIPIPVVGLRYKSWFVQGIRGGYDVFQRGAFTGSLFAQARFRGLEPDSSPFLEGMQARKKSADAGGEFVYKGRPVGFRAAFMSDVLGRSNGQEFSVSAVTGAPLGRVLLLVGAGPRWLSSDRIDYYYGVRDDEVRPGRPAYKGEATWNLDIYLTVRVKISENWSFFALVNREGFGSGIRNSPLVDQGAGYSLITSLTYDF